MQYQDVESDSVADLQVAISDDEEAVYFAADEGQVNAPLSDAAQSAAAHAQPSAVSTAHPGGAVSYPSPPDLLLVILQW